MSTEMPDLQIYNSLAIRFDKAIHLYSSVVPAALLSDITKDIGIIYCPVRDGKNIRDCASCFGF